MPAISACTLGLSDNTNGPFQGLITPTTPSGWYTTRSCLHDAQHAVQALLARAQDPLCVLRVPGERVAAREDVDHERLGPRLSGLAQDHVDELVLALEQQGEGAFEVARAGGEGERGPARLRRPRGGERAAHVLGRLHLDLADRLERRGRSETQAPPRAGRARDLGYQGHGDASAG